MIITLSEAQARELVMILSHVESESKTIMVFSAVLGAKISYKLMLPNAAKKYRVKLSLVETYLLAEVPMMIGQTPIFINNEMFITLGGLL